MEDTLRELKLSKKQPLLVVLILVLMEDTLRVIKNGAKSVKGLKS